MTESQTETKSATESATKSKPGQLPVDDVRSLIDACWKAKTITELIPALPKGMKPRYVHVIDAVWHINEPNGQDTGTARVAMSAHSSASPRRASPSSSAKWPTSGSSSNTPMPPTAAR